MPMLDPPNTTVALSHMLHAFAKLRQMSNIPFQDSLLSREHSAQSLFLVKLPHEASLGTFKVRHALLCLFDPDSPFLHFLFQLSFRLTKLLKLPFPGINLLSQGSRLCSQVVVLCLEMVHAPLEMAPVLGQLVVFPLEKAVDLGDIVDMTLELVVFRHDPAVFPLGVLALPLDLLKHLFQPHPPPPGRRPTRHEVLEEGGNKLATAKHLADSPLDQLLGTLLDALSPGLLFCPSLLLCGPLLLTLQSTKRDSFPPPHPTRDPLRLHPRRAPAPIPIPLRNE
mmetsp:Transcript_45984/g.115312  ORF Transcript_45984/g.115312 Transcript_45984/m.115312 type:complete len:281 (-) Transcript_45984:797-1639(-)